MARTLLRSALLVLCLGLAAPAGAQAAVAGPAARPSLHQVQLEILEQTNAHRERAGLRPLRLDAAMSRVATRWSQRQAEDHGMSHNPAYSRQIPAGWHRCGENVAYGYSYRQVTSAWFHSPPHRHNLLGHYDRIGIGYALDSRGVAYYTEDFGRY
jgi:uncharacterized protein YkwD